jgi:DNA replicative helicase MCM subunit Mcm2 (Cdc46/Mcm family)
MAQNPNINFTSANSIINVNGTIVKAINVNDPTKYAAFPEKVCEDSTIVR